ncbi:MAG TPA: amidohydrolase family protein, partial [Sphaerochaeta sp.]|nr:amidohydrolase family protein [Sphaerochaeta sp.]
MSSSLLLKSIYTLQTGFDKEALHGADLLIVDNKVSRIDPAGKISAKGVDRVIDCSKHVVLPGLVNTHHHFYQTLTRNHPAVQSAKLFDWLTFLYDVWKYLDEEGIYYSSLLAMAELMRTGCTLTTDHHYVYPH